MRLFGLRIMSFAWSLAKERRCAAEVNAHRQEDGEIEHTQKKHMKITHSCEKECFALCDSKKKVCNAVEISKVA